MFQSKAGVIVAIIMIVLMAAVCKKTGPSDEEKIRAVVEKQIQAFHSGSLEGEEQVWSHQPYVVRMAYNGMRVIGWDSVRKRYQTWLPKEPVQDFKFSISNYRSHISGHTAWVTHDQVSEGILNGQPLDKNQKYWDIRFLEKEQDEWKIVFHITGPIPTETRAFSAFEGQVNTMGYQLLNINKVDEALNLLKLNVDWYPDSYNAYDSYAEALMKKGDTKGAIANYQKSLELNPNNDNAKKMLQQLGK